MTYHDYDKRGVIAEAYRIEGISESECRSIFFDWALGRDDTPDAAIQIAALLDVYGAEAGDHPMSRVLREGLPGTAQPRGRRGGARRRRD